MAHRMKREIRAFQIQKLTFSFNHISQVAKFIKSFMLRLCELTEK